MKDKDYIKELFSEKLSSHEVPVRSDLWSGIQSQLGNTATTAAAAKGISVAAKWVIGIASSVVVAGSVAWFASGDADGPKVKEQLSKTEEMKPVSAPETEKPGAVIGYTEPNVVADPKDLHKTDGTETIRQEKIAVNAAGTTPPLILKQRQEETVNAAGISTPPNRGNGAAPEIGTCQNPASSSSVPGKTAATSRPVVGKIKWVNVFTPNNDKDNDELELENSNLKDFSITVFNEKMQPVYSSSDPKFKWDGTYNQEPLPAGNYGYMVIATDDNGNLIKEFKNLTIRK